MLAVNQDVHSSQVGARSIEMLPFSLRFGEFTFREAPPQAFYRNDRPVACGLALIRQG